MTKCPQCGKDVSWFDRDIITGVCGTCRKIGARPATLGCGTLLLIGIVVAIFSQSGFNNLEQRVARLETSIEQLKTEITRQTEAIRELRRAIDESRRPSASRPK